MLMTRSAAFPKLMRRLLSQAFAGANVEYADGEKDHSRHDEDDIKHRFLSFACLL